MSCKYTFSIHSPHTHKLWMKPTKRDNKTRHHFSLSLYRQIQMFINLTAAPKMGGKNKILDSYKPDQYANILVCLSPLYNKD